LGTGGGAASRSNDEKQETRKQSYRKDDRAMRPIYACPENF